MVAGAEFSRRSHLALGLFFLVTSISYSSVFAQCPSAAWSYYADNGSEGHDSCLLAASVASGSGQNRVVEATLYCSNQWSSAHLLTVLSTSSASGILPLAASLLTSSSAIIGCNQSSSAVRRGAGWTWIDGTDAGSINPNCSSSGYNGGGGCGIWAAGEPKCVKYVCLCVYRMILYNRDVSASAFVRA